MRHSTVVTAEVFSIDSSAVNLNNAAPGEVSGSITEFRRRVVRTFFIRVFMSSAARIFSVLLFLSMCEPALGTGEAQPWEGDLGFSYSDNRTNYVSRKFAADADITYKGAHDETVLEGLVDRQHIIISGAAADLVQNKYDVNVKWKHYLEDSPNYGYLSPRLRKNNTGYFTSTQAMRVGIGHKILSDDERFEMMLEAGSGYRYATLANGSQIEEKLLTISDKIFWDISSDVTLKLNVVFEESAREKYRTALIELKDKITRQVGLKYQIMHKLAYPFDSNLQGGEYTTSIGLDYEI